MEESNSIRWAGGLILLVIMLISILHESARGFEERQAALADAYEYQQCLLANENPADRWICDEG